jgi:hypothetical protein
LLNYFSIVSFNPMAFCETRDLNQQLFVAKRDIEIVIGTCGESLDVVVVGLFYAAYQEDGDRGQLSISLQVPAQLYPSQPGHNHVADDQVRLENPRQLKPSPPIRSRQNFIAFAFE